MNRLIRLSCLIIMLAGSMAAICQDAPVTVVDPHAVAPVKINFVYGQNVLELGTDKLRIDLTELGVNVFDNNCIDRTINSTKEGWVHYIMNAGWHGVLVVWEKEAGSPNDTEAKYMFIHAGDESKVIPSTAIEDGAGVFAVATSKGVMLRSGEGNGFYFPVSSALGLKEIQGTELNIMQNDPELKQKALEVRFTNASLKGIKIGVDTRQVGYLVE